MATGIVKGIKTAGKVVAAIGGVQLPGEGPSAESSSGWQTTVLGVAVMLGGIYLISTGEREIGAVIVLAGIGQTRSSDAVRILPKIFRGLK